VGGCEKRSEVGMGLDGRTGEGVRIVKDKKRSTESGKIV